MFTPIYSTQFCENNRNQLRKKWNYTKSYLWSNLNPSYHHYRLSTVHSLCYSLRTNNSLGILKTKWKFCLSFKIVLILICSCVHIKSQSLVIVWIIKLKRMILISVLNSSKKYSIDVTKKLEVMTYHSPFKQNITSNHKNKYHSEKKIPFLKIEKKIIKMCRHYAKWKRVPTNYFQYIVPPSVHRCRQYKLH